MTLSSLTPNRITLALDTVRERCDALDPADLAKLDRDMEVEFTEHFAYQQAQARAHASGLITTDEARLIYVALGEVGSPSNGGWAAETTTAEKVVVTMLMGELIGRQVREARRSS
jgi:hypothetical protein